MPQGIVKPQSVIKAEKPITTKWSAADDKLTQIWSDADDKLTNKWSDADDALTNKWSAADDKLISDHDNKKITTEVFNKKKSELYNQYKADDAKLYNKFKADGSVLYNKFKADGSVLYNQYRKDIQTVWAQNGWSQAQEDAYDKQEYDKWKPVQPDAVKPKPQVTKKPVTGSSEAAQERNKIIQLINEYRNDSYLDGKLAANRLIELRTQDANTDKINVINSEFGGRFVSVSSNGVVIRHDAKEKPVPMTDEDRTPAVKKLEEFIQNNTASVLRQKGLLDAFAAGVAVRGVEPYSVKVDLTAVLLDDGKKAIIANDKGAYEVVNVKQDAPLPSQSVGQVPPVGKGAVKQ